MCTISGMTFRAPRCISANCINDRGVQGWLSITYFCY